MSLTTSPGYIPDGSGNFRTRFGSTTSDFQAWDLTTNYELANVNNALFKMNSIHGGVIVPRGTSLVGLDLRKTKIRPKFVPNPLNDTVKSSAIFRVTGASYFGNFPYLTQILMVLCIWITLKIPLDQIFHIIN